jgi:putative transposase
VHRGAVDGRPGLGRAVRGKKHRTTIPAVEDPRPTDLVDRDFTAPAPNRLWVADFTYVATWSGAVHVAFIFDVLSRRLVGWRAATTMTTELGSTPSRWRSGPAPGTGPATWPAGAPHRAGNQYTLFAFTARLLEAGVDSSVGSVGDAYDSALAESQIGAYKTELIRPEGPSRDVEHVEIETLDWVDWFNTERPHESVDDLTPVQAEEVHYAAQNRLLPTG